MKDTLILLAAVSRRALLKDLPLHILLGVVPDVVRGTVLRI